MYISLINDIKNTSSPNAVNDQGRKLCPITHDILTVDNTIKIDGVLYSSFGFVKWVRAELIKDYENLVKLCNTSLVFDKKTDFIHLVYIRSPITNLKYDYDVVNQIFEMFVWQYYVRPIYCVYDFITKHKHKHQ